MSKAMYIFSGFNSFSIFEYRNLFYWNKSFRDEIHIAEKEIGEGPIFQNSLLDLNFDPFIDGIERSFLIFNIFQVSQAKILEKKYGEPQLLLTHSVGEMAAGVYNRSVNYKLLWKLYCITIKRCRMMASKNNKNALLFGSEKNINQFVTDQKLQVMSKNSYTSSLVWLGERSDINRKLASKYSLSLVPIKLISYPIHTTLMDNLSKESLKDIYDQNIFSDLNEGQSRFPIVSSTLKTVVLPKDLKSYDDIASTWTTLCKTSMDITTTYKIAQTFLNSSASRNYVIENTNLFLSNLKEIDSKGNFYSSLIASSQREMKILGKIYLVQDLGLFNKIGDSLSFLNTKI